MPDWTVPELNILEVLRPCCTNKEIQYSLSAAGFTRSTEALCRQARRRGWHFKQIKTPELSRLGNSYREEIANTLTTYRRESGSAPPTCPPIVTPFQKGQITTAQNREASGLLQELLQIRDSVPRIASLSRGLAIKPSLVLLLSDFHIGKTIRDIETGEITYNSEIGLERIELLPQMVRSITGSSKYHEIIVLLIGDHVDGESVYPGHNLSIDRPICEQIRGTTLSTWRCIRELRGMYPSVRLVSTRGNHGRSGLSPEANFDNIFFQELELIIDLYGDCHISISNRYGEFNTFTVQGWKGLIRHKAPIQANTPPALQKFNGWKDIHHCNLIGYGHWHHWGAFTHNDTLIIRNGALTGGDDYSETFGAHDEACQVLLSVTEEHLPLSISPLYF